ncbi:DUF397 domain-containing protein [Streptomyces albofaciens JCM 4342]|uniref:DUF397 domain-containing protein n=1 Tax=Streptomyces albofaciens TaxID=66866 RepID=UPI000A8B16BA|nr:DUF397 domain-containing protein [Streptomyces albofaciens]KAA6222015.1 DUF397 domain-containing protein [Streptomyces albofaciens JCM 4342]
MTRAFRKSTYSSADRECVEVATDDPHTIAIRDSKRTDGPTLHVSPAAWASFLTTLHPEP